MKLLEVIQSFYSNVKSCAKYDGVLDEYFSKEIGLMQGELLPPVRFALYVNDFKNFLLKNNVHPLNYR